VWQKEEDNVQGEGRGEVRKSKIVKELRERNAER
jgi:hypothetical protein